MARTERGSHWPWLLWALAVGGADRVYFAGSFTGGIDMGDGRVASNGSNDLDRKSTRLNSSHRT